LFVLGAAPERAGLLDIGIRTPRCSGVCDKQDTTRLRLYIQAKENLTLGGNVVVSLFICIGRAYMYKMPHHPSSVVGCWRERIERSWG
jgi:hypothetical protein